MWTGIFNSKARLWMLPEATPVLSEIMAALRLRYEFLNPHYEAAWTESWSHRRCLHDHPTILEAAKCAMPQGPGWYVFAVEHSAPRELTETEERVVNEFRFGPRWPVKAKAEPDKIA